MFKRISTLLRDNRSFLLFISLMLVFRSAVADRLYVADDC